MVLGLTMLSFLCIDVDLPFRFERRTLPASRNVLKGADVLFRAGISILGRVAKRSVGAQMLGVKLSGVARSQEGSNGSGGSPKARKRCNSIKSFVLALVSCSWAISASVRTLMVVQVLLNFRAC